MDMWGLKARIFDASLLVSQGLLKTDMEYPHLVSGLSFLFSGDVNLVFRDKMMEEFERKVDLIPPSQNSWLKIFVPWVSSVNYFFKLKIIVRISRTLAKIV